MTQTRRTPAGPPEGFSRVVPDLAVEVLSPGDRERNILDTVGEYLAAGVRLVWVIDPRARRATVHRSMTQVRELAEGPAGTPSGVTSPRGTQSVQRESP